MAEYKYVLYEKKEGVAVITMNRPERRNALGAELRRDLNAALKVASEDDSVGAIIVTGAGSAWSAGADLTPEPGRRNQFERLEWSVKVNQDAVLDSFWMRSFSKPIIAAVNGWCLGAAFELCLNMDILMASEDARFGAPEIKHGSIQRTRLPFHIGPQLAKKIYLSGDLIDGKEAYRIGLVTDCVPREKLMDAAMRLAKRIAKVPRHAVMMNKLMIDGVVDDMGFMNGLSRAGLYDAMCHYLMGQPHTESAKLFAIQKEKGVKSFLEAREANFPPEEAPYGMITIPAGQRK